MQGMCKNRQLLKFIFFLFLGLICVSTLSNNNSSATDLTHLGIEKTPHLWRLVFDSTHKPSHRCSLLDPKQLELIVERVQFFQAPSPDQFQQTPITAVHWKSNSKGELHLFLNFDQALKLKSYTRAPTPDHGHQLVVELYDKHFVVKEKPVIKVAEESIVSKPKPRTHLSVKSPPVESNFENVQTDAKPVINNVSSNKHSKNIIIVVDPGHGGKDPGTTGPRGTREKNVVLEIGKELAAAINRQRGFQAILTRDRDYYLTLRERLHFARKYRADMFVSIHADAAFRNQTARGASIYALSLRGATSEAARWLAKRENESELMGGVNLSDQNAVLKSVLINLSQNATIQTSLEIGMNLLRAINLITPLHYHHVEQAAFVVLKSPDIPSILIETGFLSNPIEEQRLNDPRYRRQLANAVMKGLVAYFSARPPPGTLIGGRR